MDTLFDKVKAGVRNRVSQDSWLRMAAVWHYATLPPLEVEWRIEPRARASRERLRAMRDQHRGKRCVIIGNGPSLNRTNLPALASELTFGMNRIYLAFDRLGFVPTFYVAINRLVIEQCVDEILGIQGPTKFLAWSTRELLPADPSVVFLREQSRPRFSTDPGSGIWGGATVTYAALQLAYYLGFSKVVLVGVDHSFVTQGEPHKAVTSTGDDPNHFSPAYFGKGFRWQLPDLRRSEVAYSMARRAFERDGREIVDATVGGKLEVFRKADFDDLFPGT